MAELNQDKNTFRSHKNPSGNLGYCWSTFLHLLRVNWGFSILGPAFMIYCSLPFLLILAAFLYSDDIREHQKPEITVFLAEKVSPDKAALLAKMAAAVSVTYQITIIEPKTAAKKVAKTLNLSADLQEAIKFPRTIQIIFPNDADPLVLEELAQLLAADSRVTGIFSTIETYKLLQRTRCHWVLILSIGLCLTGVINLLFGYFLITIIGRPHISEMSSMFLLGVPSLESSRPLQILGLVFGAVYLLGCLVVYPALVRGMTTSVDWFFYFHRLNEPKLDLPSMKILISLAFMVVMYLVGVLFAIRRIHDSVMKLASENE